MNTLQSVVDTTTPFVSCQYPAQQNPGFGLVIIVNLSLQSALIQSVDRPPGKTSPLSPVPLYPSFDPRRVYPFDTSTNDFKLLLTRAPPRR